MSDVTESQYALDDVIRTPLYSGDLLILKVTPTTIIAGCKKYVFALAKNNNTLSFIRHAGKLSTLKQGKLTHLPGLTEYDSPALSQPVAPAHPRTGTLLDFGIGTA